MKKHYIILCAALLALSACGVNGKKGSQDSTAAAGVDTNSTKIADTALVAEMHIKENIKAGEPVELKFIVYNRTDSTRKFCKWHTPFEPLMSKYLEIKNEQGVEVDYKGPMAKRMMPPPADSYIAVNVKDSLAVTADLLKAYDIKTPAKYTVTYVGSNMSGLVVKQSVTFTYSK